MPDLPQPATIPRRLRMLDDRAREHVVVDQDDLAAMEGPLVVLGDPGLGKSVLARVIGGLPGSVYVRAGTFVRSRRPEQFRPEGGLLVVDGLDEVGSTVAGAGVDAVLGQLSAVSDPPPRFLLAGREADWRGSADRIRIEDDYGRPATVLHLQPFDREDALRFLGDAFPAVDAERVLTHLAERGLDEIYRNPLTLRMIGEVAAAGDDLPATRAQLLDRAVRLMLTEANPRHGAAPHALAPEEDLLLAAGALCASLLLCDRTGIHDGPTAELPEDHLSVAGIAALPHASDARLALRTRLFQADGENRFVPIHRVVAEYLGARWLAACHRSGASERRIRALVTHGGGVPSSLRGLNAWLAHFDELLAPACIALDPYAVLRYGDAETLSLANAGLLLDALAGLSAEDPYFRSEDWGDHPLSGLVRPELAGQLATILGGPAGAGQLGVMLLGAIAGTDVANALAPALSDRVFDPDLPSEVRGRALAAVLPIGMPGGVAGSVERLLAMGDHASAALAHEIVASISGSDVPPDLVAATLLAYAGLSRSHLGRGRRRAHRSAYISDEMFGRVDADRLDVVLDELAAQAAPLMRGGDHWAKDQVADAIRGAAIVRLGLSDAVDPMRVWAWVGWLRGHEGDEQSRSALSARLRGDDRLRREIQASILLGPGAEAVREGWIRVAHGGVGVHPDAGDVAALLDRLAERPGAPDRDTVVEVAAMGRDREGLPAEVLAAAGRAARGDAGILDAVAALARPFDDTHAADRQRRLAEQEEERRVRYAEIREGQAALGAEIDAGDCGVLNQAAKVYLGRYSEFGRDTAPEERAAVLLGPELAERTLLGFMAALRRDDLPSAATIAGDHAVDREWRVEPVLVCGVAEAVRRDIDLAGFPPAALESAFMAWRRAGESNVVGGIEVGPQLEAQVMPDEASAERFFRTSIEPQLAAGQTHVHDLYLLRHRPELSGLAGRLAAEWLEAFPDIPTTVMVQLLSMMLRAGPTEANRRVVAAGRARGHGDREADLAWLTAAFVTDFEGVRADAARVAADDPGTIWHFRERVGGRRHVGDGAVIEMSVAQRAFLVEGFMDGWPLVRRPEGTSSGEENAWDASDFIERMFYSIAGERSAEATEALERLVARRSTYGEPLRHALALQRRIRRDAEFVAADLPGLSAVVDGGLPADIDDMRAYLADRVDRLRRRMHAANTDMWEAYWDADRPRSENFCRNRLVEHLSRELPEAIRLEPEMHMPDQKRADIAAILGAIGLPVEIKGQWHPEVWSAPVEQLAARYGREWHAQGRGVYVVLWFGDVPGRNLPAHTDGLPRPQTPAELEAMLRDRLPGELRRMVDVHVVDVSRSRPPTSRELEAASRREGSADAGVPSHADEVGEPAAVQAGDASPADSPAE